jgi:hypothetical protein
MKKNKILMSIVMFMFVVLFASTFNAENANARRVSAYCGFDDDGVCCVPGSACGCLLPEKQSRSTR